MLTSLCTAEQNIQLIFMLMSGTGTEARIHSCTVLTFASPDKQYVREYSKLGQQIVRQLVIPPFSQEEVEQMGVCIP